MLFYFIFLFRFYLLFFSYLWDNYRTLLITVLFIRTDRLSCINIRVIIIIIIIIIILITIIIIIITVVWIFGGWRGAAKRFCQQP